VTLVWLAVVAIVFWLALARLLTPAVQPSGGSDVSPGFSDPGSGQALPYYYYAPGGQGFGP